MSAIRLSKNLPDREQYIKLFLSTGWNEKYKLDDDSIYNTLRNSYYIVSALEGNKLVGFGRIISDGIMHALIVDMIIDPEYQGKGIGTLILEDLVGVCVKNEIVDIQLFCARDKEPFYLKNGFSPRPENAPGMEYVGEK
jgi:GNAT superfamily N-acetyltransferase